MKTLKTLYQQMADLTRPKCGSCRVPLSCCSSEYCEETLRFAEKQGTPLQTTQHPKLPLMGDNGCTAPPHLRPICTVHVCEQHLMDVDFAEKYYTLREELSEADERLLG